MMNFQEYFAAKLDRKEEDVFFGEGSFYFALVALDYGIGAPTQLQPRVGQIHLCVQTLDGRYADFRGTVTQHEMTVNTYRNDVTIYGRIKREDIEKRIRDHRISQDLKERLFEQAKIVVKSKFPTEIRRR